MFTDFYMYFQKVITGLVVKFREQLIKVPRVISHSFVIAVS